MGVDGRGGKKQAKAEDAHMMQGGEETLQRMNSARAKLKLLHLRHTTHEILT